MTATKKSIKELADRLISTLDSMMDNDRADAIVRDVAEELYNDVLGIKGHIVVDRTQPSGHMHIGGSRGVKKHVATIAKYKFEPGVKS